MIAQADQGRLDKLEQELRQYSTAMMGYPVSDDLDFGALKPFIDHALNNIGDPFSESGTYKVETRQFEREVVEFWARLTHAPKDDWWGYITNGGTEGNLYGLYLARELHPDGIVYFSRDTHYSVTKNLHFLNMRNIMIRSQPNGEIDYEDLRETLKIKRDVPPIIFANIGTTMTEAKDDVGKIHGMMEALAIPQYYIHSDAAMSGAMAPFMDSRPSFDFSDGADSISISGHKFIGSPIPCGIVLARKSNVHRIARSIAYIGSMDTTVSGSRNGLTPLFLWYAMKSFGEEGMRKRVESSLQLAEYAERELRKIGVDAWRNPNSLTVVMPQVEPEIQDKWQLASAQGISHIMLMPNKNITRETVDEFVVDVVSSHENR